MVGKRLKKEKKKGILQHVTIVTRIDITLLTSIWQLNEWMFYKQFSCPLGGSGGGSP